MDLRLLPLLGMLYALALIDRTNLGIARIAGMEHDLVHLNNILHCLSVSDLKMATAIVHRFSLQHHLCCVFHALCSLVNRRFSTLVYLHAHDKYSQLPSNIFLRYLGVRNWLAFCVVAWGGVQLGMGFVPNWGLLAFLRVLLGAFEVSCCPPVH